MLQLYKTAASRQTPPAAAPHIGILPAAFNPPTLAHIEIAREALRECSLAEVLFLLPRVFPHKVYTGASFEARLQMLQAALAAEPKFSIGSTDQGLFIDIARACRPAYGPSAEFFFLCGSDAAARIVTWDYGPDVRFADLLREFQMLVVPRGRAYLVPPEYAARIHPLALAPPFQSLSSSDVRSAIASGHPWEHLVPPPVAAVIRQAGLYKRKSK